MPLEVPAAAGEQLLVVGAAQEEFMHASPSWTALSQELLPTAEGLSDTEVILICCIGFALGYFFRWVSAAHTPVDMGYVLALLDTDGDGHVDKEEIAYAARLILHDKQREIADLPHKIAQQEHKEHRWNMFFSVSILICAGSTTWSYAAFGEDMKLLLAFVPSLLLVMFCFVQLIRQRALLSRLRKRKHDSKMFIQHLKGGGSEPWPLQPARDAARDVARLQEPFLSR